MVDLGRVHARRRVGIRRSGRAAASYATGHPVAGDTRLDRAVPSRLLGDGADQRADDHPARLEHPGGNGWLVGRCDGPCVDGSELARRIFTSQSWSVQPCVRPLSAVHMTAGHSALRGSGPGHKPAFENAMAQVGCPDRRIDRLCITCCSPSQPSHHAMVLGAISSDPQRGWIIVSLAPGHQCPSHSGELVGKGDGSDFDRPSCQQCCDPGPDTWCH
jgi:hypothetical protein